MKATRLRVRSFFTITVVMLALGAAHARAQERRTVRFPAGPLTAVVVFEDPGVAKLEPELRKLLAGAFTRYRALFGGPPRGADGRSLHTITITLLSGRVGEGEADPGTVRVAVGEQPVFGFYDWRLTILHECFHLWNGESFRYASGGEQWFNEGISEFYAVQTAARLGLIDPLHAVAITSTGLGFYASAPGLGTVSLTDAAQTPELKFRNYFLVYEGGWMAGLVLDHDIRTRTKGKHSLDDLMRRMYSSFDRPDRRYTTDDVVAQLRAATNFDYTPFFERHIRGATPIPVANHLSLGNAAFALTAPGANPRVPALDRYLAQSLGVFGTAR
jgi:hypothetical protein